MKKINVDEDNIRLDTYVARKVPELSRTMIQKLIESGDVLVNDDKKKLSYKVLSGDIITINIPEAKEVDLKPQEIPVEVVYEDNDIIVVNKPKGMVVHPANGNPDGTLVNAIMAMCKDSLSGIGGELRPGIVHRIDKDTSGLLIVAKTDKAHEALSKQLKDKTLYREYIALVSGRINHDTGEIDAPIGRDINDRKKMCVTDVNSKEAITYFKVLERYKNATLIEVKLKTGRTHQIRVHMKYINHPIINDPVYGNKKSVSSFGQMLHAKKISFVHPITNKIMTFTCDEPEEFNKIKDKYKNE